MDESQTDAFAVVIVNYGLPNLLAQNIGADLDGQAGAQVVVVDNFHSERARELTARLCRERGWLLVPSPNDGFGAGVNRGIAAARGRGHQVFITLNPDAVASARVLRELAHHARTHPDALISPYMDDGEGRPHFRGAGVHRRTGQMRSGWATEDQDPVWKNWLSGACLALRAEAFDRVGGLSEEYFLYWEDVDISRRAAELGMTLVLRDDLLVVHDEGGTHTDRDARAKSPLYYYYNIRNRLLFGRRTLSGRDRLHWLLATPRQSLLIWLRGGRRQLLTHPRGAWAALRGAVAGLGYRGFRPSSFAHDALTEGSLR
ncbi:glycosyltransferase family 2 protein [Brachybacterium sp. AOP29-B2-41]|uniref:glycosyltransferase family 2 protein n=1 Tax=Brachybacterium sp. AOP29-B2-41 TaxID=3457704 RepID=UPI0040334526